MVPTNHTHSFTLNAINKVTTNKTPLNQTTTYNYDRDRRLTDITLPSGQIIHHNYRDGLLQDTQTPEGLIEYEYQCGNKLTSVREGSETLSYDYSGVLLNRIEYSGELDAVISYDYAPGFELSSMTYAGESSAIKYDKDGLITNIHDFTIERNPQNDLPEYVRDAKLTQERNFNGFAEAEDFNQRVSGGAVVNNSYQYNAVGQITEKTEVVNSGSGNVSHRYEYEYDNKYRLTKVYRDDEIVEQYGYDANGNRTATTSSLLNVSAVAATYNIADQLLTFGNKVYEYDANGRLSKVTRTTDDNAQVVTTYQCDSQGRLLKVVTPAKTIEYKHNALGNRVAKLIDGEIVEKYLWQNKTTLLAVYDGGNSLKQRFEYTLGHVPTRFTQAGQRYYILTDQVGSPKIISDAHGGVIKQIDYDAFGNVVSDSNPEFEIPYGFAGEGTNL